MFALDVGQAEVLHGGSERVAEGAAEETPGAAVNHGISISRHV